MITYKHVIQIIYETVNPKKSSIILQYKVVELDKVLTCTKVYPCHLHVRIGRLMWINEVHIYLIEFM